MNDQRPASDPDRTQVILCAGVRCFGRYTLKREIGAGGMGVVWLARDEQLETEVALKFLHESVRHDPEAVRDLKREVRRCHQLSHPNIVRVHDFVEDARATAIAMEYVPGASLAARKVAKANGCFDVAELAPLVEQLCLALEHAHVEARIVHCDIKPANLIVTDSGRLKLADFGIARSLVETKTRLSHDLRGGAATLSFASPQQLAGRAPAPVDDIYAVGATLYDLLTGKPPFFRGDLRGQIESMLPTPLARRRAELENTGKPIPRAWEETILACLEKRAEARPQRIMDVVGRLAQDTPALIPGGIDPDVTEGFALPSDPDATERFAPPRPGMNAIGCFQSKIRAPESGQPWTIPGLGLVIQPIGAGRFAMGSPAVEPDRWENEGPQTWVTMTRPFWLGKTQVTQREWQAIIGNNPARFKGGDHPVENISWAGAMEFCHMLTARERAADRLPDGYVYTLPTEPQWEYACRAGTTSPFHVGSKLDASMANFDGNFPYGGASKGEHRRQTTAVGGFKPNAWGLHDMHGNVWEWCADWYVEKLPGGSVCDPVGARVGSLRVLRGGSWDGHAKNCRSARRSGDEPGARVHDLGFRLALSWAR